jgi:hypothetical protein
VLNLAKLAGVALQWIIVAILEHLFLSIFERMTKKENRCDLNANHTYQLSVL